MTEPVDPSALTGETTDRAPASDSKTSCENRPGEPAFSIDPVAADLAESGPTTDFSPERTTDPRRPATAAREAAATTRLWDTGIGAGRRAVEVPASVAGYEILGLLGRGGMGVVYKARQPGLKRLVALKMILSGEHASERELSRFRSEAEAVAQLHHVNIVQIYEVGEDAGRPYFSLEFIDGDSLTKKVDGTPLPPRPAAELMLQMARAIDYAHQRGIIHRDIKPANILLTADGIPKITDFGLAKRSADESGQTHSGTVLGTPSYMPPEQAEGRIADIGPLSDVYSLGAVLYDLLTGRPPFRGTTMLDTLQMVQTCEPIAPAELQPTVPRDLQTICLRCLRKDPARRYASAAALAEDLRRFLAGEPILARPAGIVERLVRWCRRNPRVAALSAVVIVLLIVWAATSSVLYSAAVRNERHAEENAQLARENAQQAQDNANKAQQQEKKAIMEAEVARTRQQRAFLAMVDMGGTMQKRLRSRRLSEKLGPQGQVLRQQLMDVLRRKMLAMAAEMESKGIHSYANVALHQQLGDLLLRLGQGTEALRQYEEGCRLMRAEVKQLPDRDLARANLGVMLMRLGDIALNVHGDARAARDYYRQGWDLQQEIHEHPRGDFPTEQSVILLSHHALRLGWANLRMGLPTEAAKQFEEAWKLRQEWHELRSKRKPRTGESRSWMAQALLWLGTTDWHSGDAKACDEHFRRCLDLYAELLKEYPRDNSFNSDAAEIHQMHGDALLHLGRPDEAARSYRRAREYLDLFLSHDPDDPTPLPLSALLYERLGDDAQRCGQREEARKHYREALDIRQDLVRLEPENWVWQAAFLLTAARCGRCEEAARGADNLRRRGEGKADLLLQLARCYGVCAARTENRPTYIAKGREALKALRALDFRDEVLLRTDVDLVPLLAEPHPDG